MLEKGHFPFFDSAYQGFASGDFARDAAAISAFVADGHRVAVAQSFAKNMGMYGQRVGCLSVLCGSQAEARAVESQLKMVARPMYSNPPAHGAVLAATILEDPALKQQWFGEVKGMADRIILMRSLLRKALEAGGPHSWKHVTDQAREKGEANSLLTTLKEALPGPFAAQAVPPISQKTHLASAPEELPAPRLVPPAAPPFAFSPPPPAQIGMFTFTGLTPEQVDKLELDHQIFMTRNGRISMARERGGASPHPPLPQSSSGSAERPRQRRAAAAVGLGAQRERSGCIWVHPDAAGGAGAPWQPRDEGPLLEAAGSWPLR